MLNDLLLDWSRAGQPAEAVEALLADFRRRTSWDTYGGGVLLGVDGVLVVGHGRATARAVTAAIALAHRCVQTDVCGNIQRFTS